MKAVTIAMRMMSMFTVAILTVCIARSASAIEPSETYLNKRYWQEMDWGNAESSKLWRMDGWLPFEGEQSTYATFVKRRKLTLLGHQFDANLAYLNKRYLNQHFTSLYTQIARPECDVLLKELTAKFGKPLMNDGTIAIPVAEDTFVRMIDYEYQWDMGDTRLLASCSGNASQNGEIVKDEGQFTWSMKFAHRSLTPKLEPKFALICTRTITYTTDGKTSNLNDLVAWFDLSRSRVLSTNLVILSDKDSFHATDDDIRFSMTRTDYVMDYTVNRISGSLTATINENGQRVGNIAGKCEKTEAPVKKF